MSVRNPEKVPIVGERSPAGLLINYSLRTT